MIRIRSFHFASVPSPHLPLPLSPCPPPDRDKIHNNRLRTIVTTR